MPKAAKKPSKKPVTNRTVTNKFSIKNRKINIKTALIVAIVVGLVGFGVLGSSFAAVPSGDNVYEQIAVVPGQDDATTGLKKVKENADHPCAGAYEVDGKLDAEGDKICTSSNEKLPANPLSAAKTKQLQAVVSTMGTNSSDKTISSLKSTGKIETNPTIAKEYTAATSAAGNVAYQGAVPFVPTATSCYGTGKDGQRVVIIAAGTKEKPITQAEINTIQNVAGQMESTLIWNSYKQNPDKVMHWRFLQSGDCRPRVITATQAADYYNELSVVTYASLKQDSGILAAANAAKAEAAGQGMLPHFLVFTRSGGNACGQSDFNLGGVTNSQETFSFVYGATPTDRSGTQCWNGLTAQHELLHSLGAVDFTAPHTTFFGHCSDEYEIMCYNDTNNAIPMQNVCPVPATDPWTSDYLMDCNADDYFSVKPNADSVFNPAPWWLGGSGFARYNTAKSGFMTDKVSTGSLENPTTPTPAPNLPPAVSLTAPANNATVTAGTKLKIDATATDKDGIQQVVFYNGTTELGIDTTSPYSLEVTVPAVAKMNLKAKAVDKTNSTTMSAEVVVNVTTPAGNDPTPPVGPATLGVGMTFDLFQGGYGINLSWPAATDNVKVTQYRVFRNDVEIAKVAGTSYRDRAISAGGTYGYQVFAEDAALNRSTGTAKQTRKVQCFLIFCGI